MMASTSNYVFNGAANPAIKPVNPDYALIQDQFHLYDILKTLWNAETCAPRMRQDWSQSNPTLGQCSITAFLVQDIFGGDVYGILLEDGNYHCYNVIGDTWFDLTSEQFGAAAKDFAYENNPLQSRDTHFAKAEKKARYELLKNMLQDKIKDLAV